MLLKRTRPKWEDIIKTDHCKTRCGLHPYGWGQGRLAGTFEYGNKFIGNTRSKRKGKFVPVLAMKACKGSRGIAPLKCLKPETDHSPPSKSKVKNMWSYTSTPICLHGVVFIKHSDNLTFTFHFVYVRYYSNVENKKRFKVLRGLWMMCMKCTRELQENWWQSASFISE